MNNIYLDQLSKRISEAFGHSHGYQDALAAEKALEWLLAYIKQLLLECPQTEETGLCDMTYRHYNCAAYMSILYDLSGDDSYLPKYSWD